MSNESGNLIISILNTLAKCTHLSASYHMSCGHHYHWHNENLKNDIGIIGDGMGIY